MRQYLRQGWPTDLEDHFKPYNFRQNELSLLNDCVLWGARVVIPPPGRKLVLEELHETHLGVSKMKALARSYIWWPQMDAKIEETVKTCSDCQHPLLSLPCTLGCGRHNHGVVSISISLDHSKVTCSWCWWMHTLNAHIMQSTSSAMTIEKLHLIFSTHGLPQKIVSDNGPSFTSDEFKKFMQKNGIRHVTSAPYHLSTNGLAE